MDLVDFNGMRVLPRFYGGNAGRKICVEGPDGAPWIVKFPEPTGGMRGNVASYTTSPVSEWLGSHIYSLLGIPVHETILGFREGKFVCACRDFTWPDARLIDFHDLKNSLSDDLSGSFESRPSDGRSLFLSDVLSGIENLGEIYPADIVRSRFWDMFVVDAFIGNADRNNENWGLLARGNEVLGLAPVYDNGNAFFNKRRGSQAAERARDNDAIRQDAIRAVRSCFLKDDGHPIAPMKYIAQAADDQCNAALERFMERIDLDAVCRLVDELPGEFLNFTVMPEEVKRFHKDVLRKRVQLGFAPALAKAQGSLSVRKANME